MDKKDVARILEEIGTLLEILGENPFKSRAYHNASRVIEGLSEDLGTLAREGKLDTISGIGKGLAEKIQELLTSGKMSYYEEVKSKLPPGVPEMMRIPGLGPKRIKILYDKLKISSLEELRSAAEAHRLEKLEGFGAKTEENILRGLTQIATHADKHLYPIAEGAALRIFESLKALKQVKRVEVAGSLRRKKEVIGDIDILVSAAQKDRSGIMERFVTHEDVANVIAHGETKSSALLKEGINCDVRIVTEAEFPFALNYFTGSKDHNVEMRSRARDRGWSLNEYAFTAIKEKSSRSKKRPPPCHDEEDIYKALGLSYVPPELRENLGEFQAAEKGKIPKLLEEKDLKGTFHCHTSESDGVNTLQEMTDAARKRGWKYLGIADHSKVAAYAGGLSVERLRKQIKAIGKLNDTLKDFRVFAGSEVDILADGSLDFPDSVLASLDYVVVSIHSKFKMTEAEATKRIIKALTHRYVTILGHPTGRLLLEREGYPVNLPEVIKAAADHGKSIEINAHPLRLDLDWRFLRLAKEKRVHICINPDAHTTAGLDDCRYGVGVARKGWLTAKDVVNAWNTKEVEKFFRTSR